VERKVEASQQSAQSITGNSTDSHTGCCTLGSAATGFRCAFASAAGKRCGTSAFIEFHHVEPFAAGGPPTSENIQLRCRAHNSYEAQLYFDPAGLADATTCPGAG